MNVLRRLAIGLGLACLFACVGSGSGAGYRLTMNPGIWATASDLALLPTSGAAWDNLLAAANTPITSQNLAALDDVADQLCFAKGLVFARTGTASYRDQVVTSLTNLVNSGAYGGRALELGRNLAGYVVAADLIDLPTFNPSLNTSFRAKILALRDVATTTAGLSIKQVHDQRPHNWGAMCGASRIAVDIYLDDSADLALAANTLKGWLGDQVAWDGFTWSNWYNDGIHRYWTGDINDLVAVGPVGSTFNGNPMDGFLHSDMYRGCDGTGCNPAPWPPLFTAYPWASMSGVLTQAWMLSRQGYDPFNWSSQGIRRAHQYLYWLDGQFGTWYGPARSSPGYDNGHPWVVNKVYGTSYPAVTPTRYVGNRQLANDFADWTHGPSSPGTPPPPAVFYVSTSGNDVNAGTLSSPWKTIRKGLTALRAGDTLYVRGGTYSERLGAGTPIAIRQGTASLPVLVQNYPSERPILKGLLWLDRPSYWTVDGLNVAWDDATGQPAEHMVKLANGVGWTFENAEISGARSLGAVFVTSTISTEPSGWTIANNWIHDVHPTNPLDQDNGVFVQTRTSPGGTLERNVVWNVTNGAGILLAGGSSSDSGPKSISVRYNTIYNVSQGVVAAWKADLCTIYHNLITKTKSTNGCIRGYQLALTTNDAHDNFGFDSKQMIVNDAGPGRVVDSGANVFGIVLAETVTFFSYNGVNGFLPLDVLADNYGRWAP